MQKAHLSSTVREPLLVVTANVTSENDPVMKFLSASTGGGVNKIFQGWEEMKYEFGVSSGLRSQQILELSEGLTRKFKGRQIVLLLDEIRHKSSLSKLGEQSIPESVRLILVLNPRDFGSDSKESLGHPITLPPSFLHVTLTTPYQSTIAITKLARFIAQRRTLGVMLWEPNP